MRIFILLLLSTTFLCNTINAQNNDSLANEIAKNTRHFSTDTNAVSAMSKLEKVSMQVNVVTQNLTQKFNISNIEKALDDVEQKLQFSEAYINTTDTHLSYRLLKVHAIYLQQMRNSLDIYTNQLQKYNQEIAKVEKEISSFIADSGYKKIYEMHLQETFI